MNALRTNIDWLNLRMKKIVKSQKAFRLQDDKIAAFGFAGVKHLVEAREEGQLHPGKLCQALLRLVQSMGVTVLTNIEIKSFARANGRIILQTGQGPTLTAGQLLVCTNGFREAIASATGHDPGKRTNSSHLSHRRASFQRLFPL